MGKNSVVIVVACVVVLVLGAVVIRRSRGADSIERESIVLLGDSITAEGDWSALLPEWPLVNRGFFGFTSAELVQVASEVGRARPRAVVVLAGTNDIRDGHDAAWTTRHLTEIIDALETLAPGTTVIIQTLLPRIDAPDAVRRANVAIQSLAIERGLRVLDLHTPFDDGRGGLRSGETTDGIHLSAAGYTRWADLLRPELAGLPAPSDIT